MGQARIGRSNDLEKRPAAARLGVLILADRQDGRACVGSVAAPARDNRPRLDRTSRQFLCASKPSDLDRLHTVSGSHRILAGYGPVRCNSPSNRQASARGTTPRRPRRGRRSLRGGCWVLEVGGSAEPSAHEDRGLRPKPRWPRGRAPSKASRPSELGRRGSRSRGNWRLEPFPRCSCHTNARPCRLRRQ